MTQSVNSMTTYYSCSNGRSLVTAVADTPSDFSCRYKSGSVAKNIIQYQYFNHYTFKALTV